MEAALIAANGIPQLTETLGELQAAGLVWLGTFDETGLTGAVSWRVLDDGTVDIHRLVVAPRAFRRGIATALLDALDARFPGRHALVSTGRDNGPARDALPDSRLHHGPRARGDTRAVGHGPGTSWRARRSGLGGVRRRRFDDQAVQGAGSVKLDQCLSPAASTDLPVGDDRVARQRPPVRHATRQLALFKGRPDSGHDARTPARLPLAVVPAVDRRPRQPDPPERDVVDGEADVLGGHTTTVPLEP